MEEELQQLRDFVVQLRADNKRLLRDGSAGLSSGGVSSTSYTSWMFVWYE